MQIRPLKRFSQNFLRNKNIATEIIEALEISSDDTIIEIGPGKGVLSRIILDWDFDQYFAIEIDPRFINELKPIFKHHPRSHLIIGDIQNISFANYFYRNNIRIKVVGNIPYNITTSIMFLLLDNYKFLKESVLMIQREVAKRLLALPGTKEYGILSVLVGAQADINLIRHIKAENFYPRPKIDSTVIKLIYHEKIEDVADIDFFRQMVRQSFQTRRKTLKNNLARFLNSEDINKLKKISLSKRPEELSINDFKTLFNEIEKVKK